MTAEKKTSKEQLMHSIAPEVKKIEQVMRQDLQVATVNADPLLREILQYGLFNGGKRLRPLLVVLSAQLCNCRVNPKKDKKSAVYELAVAFEYLHSASLYHDDVIDHADMRRGKPSVNNKFGMIAAILGGDFLHSRSMYLVGALGGVEALDIFCKATNAMVNGEFVQLRNTQDISLSETDYFAAVKGKTALFIAATCELGALVSNATASEQQALAEYGMNLGTAFQIIDDLLDYQGNPVDTGKTVGNDFQEGKMTLPLIYALSIAKPEDKKRLLLLIEKKSVTEHEFIEAYGLIEQYNGFERSRKKAESVVENALSGLQVFSDEKCRPILNLFKLLTQYVLSRKK